MKKAYQLAVFNDSTLLLYFDVTRMRFRIILAICDLQHRYYTVPMLAAACKFLAQ